MGENEENDIMFYAHARIAAFLSPEHLCYFWSRGRLWGRENGITAQAIHLKFGEVQ